MDQQLDFEGLALRLRQRREQLGLTLSAVPDAGGPSARVASELERNMPASVPTRRTLYRLDRAMVWKAGTSWRILNRCSDAGEDS